MFMGQNAHKQQLKDENDKNKWYSWRKHNTQQGNASAGLGYSQAAPWGFGSTTEV